MTKAGRRPGIDVLLVVIAAAMTVLLYLPVVPSGLVSDDWSILYRADVRTPGELLRLLEPASDWFYRPVQSLVFLVSLRLFGPVGWPLHMGFIGVHLANGVLLWRVGKSFNEPIAGAVAAALFLLSWRLHEAVSWAAAGSELLAGCFSLLAVLAFLRWNSTLKLVWCALAVGSYTLAALSKESAAALPAAVAMLAVLAKSDKALWRRLTGTLPLFAIAALFVMMQVLTANHADDELLARGGLSYGPQPSSVWIVTDLLTAGLPNPIGSTVGLAPSAEPRQAAVFVLLVAVGLGMAGSRLALFAAGWAIASCLVYVPFIEAIEDRYIYLPALGVTIILGSLASLPARLATQKTWQRAGGLIAACATIAMVVLGLPSLSERVSSWTRAGAIAQSALARAQQLYPRPDTGATLQFVGLPDTVDGAFVFRNGLTEAVRIVYNNRTLHAIRLANMPSPPGSYVVLVEP